MRWLSKNATDRLNAHANRTGAEFVDCRDVSEDHNALLSTGKKPFVIVTDSPRLAKTLYACYSGEMPSDHEGLKDILLDDDQNLTEMLKGRFFDIVGLDKDQVAVIRGENSDQKQTLDLIRQINQQPQLRLLIYNSALGSGCGYSGLG